MNHSMPSSFKREEWDYLTGHLRLTTAGSLDRRYSIASSDLQNEQECALYLDRLASIYQSPSRMITASLFAKRYAFMLISPGLYAMTMYNKGLNLAIGNCRLESVYHKETWMPNLRMANITVTQPVSDNRYEWRDQVIKDIFSGHLVKVWHSISKAAGLSTSVLWENTAIYVYSLYEKRIAEEAVKQEKFRMQEDFEYLIDHASADLFGEKKNPLTRFYSPKCMVPASDQPMRVRKTCCLYYKVSANESYCSSCPVLNKQSLENVTG